MIKFRAWDNRYKEYIKNVMVDGRGKVYFDDGVATQDDLDIHVEQFTGLKDVNGKEIYEGDIIKSIPNDPLFELSKFGVVTRSRIDLKWCYESGNIEYNIWASGRYRSYEVIGNVHDNPDLLEEEK